MENKMLLGIDCSSYFDELDDNAKYYYQGKEIDPYKYFIEKNNVSCFRLRLWNNPYDENGKPYGAGTNDYARTLKLAKIALSYGYKLVLDFHYSDFWADPGKQTLPKEWKDLSFEELKEKVYEYTLKTLQDFKKEGIDFMAIQIGNEITNGMLWPHGKLIEDGNNPRSNYENLTSLLKQGIKAKNEVYPHALTIIHLERSGNAKIYNEYFDNMAKYNVDFDIIGASYYAYWHGTFDEFFDNMRNLQKKYHKDIMVMEFAYAFTADDYLKSENNQMITRQEGMYFPYPLTPEGQEECVSTFLERCKKENIKAIFYWEPCWLPREHTYWATNVGQKYIHEEGKSNRNEWSNQCLFDYDGNALPALDKFKI